MSTSILSINSNKPMNYLLQTVLSERYNMIPVSDVFQGMHEIKKRKVIELIIIDVDYHTEENWDFIQHIKTSGLYQDIPVIVLITDESKRTSGKLTEAKVDNFFYKPFSPLDIIRTIDELMLENKVTN